MIINDQKKKASVAAILVGGDAPPEEAPPMHEKELCFHELCDAIEKKDVQAGIAALEAFIRCELSYSGEEEAEEGA